MYLDAPVMNSQNQRRRRWSQNRYYCLACSFVAHSLVLLPALWLVAGGAGGSGGEGFGEGGGVVAYVHLADNAAGADVPIDTGEPMQEDTAEVTVQGDEVLVAHSEPVLQKPPVAEDAIPILQKKPEETPSEKEKPVRTAPVAKPVQKSEEPPKAPPAAATRATMDTGQNTSDRKGEQAPGIGDGDTAGTGGSGGAAEGTGPQEGEGRGDALFGFSLADVDSHPAVLRRTTPVYPESARRKRISGEVVLRFLLEASGKVSHLQVIRSEPAGIFDQASLAAVKQWRFSPAMKDGRAVPAWVEVPLQFSLR